MPNQRGASISVADAELLLGYIDALCELDSGLRAPRTPEQEHFVAVCRGKARPETRYEIAYISWRRLKPDLRDILIRAEQARQHLNTLEGTPHNLSEETMRLLGQKTEQRGLAPLGSQEALTKAEKERQIRAAEMRASEPPRPTFEKQKMVETWGDRSAWRNDSARNRFNGR